MAVDDRPFVPSGDSADEEETIDMEEESAAKVCVLYLLFAVWSILCYSLGRRARLQ